MDIRTILNKLDTVVLSEAITLQDVAAAVKGKEKDEQGRAEILNDLAWKHKLPGLYDPISGYFVGKQSMPQGFGGEGRYSIAATGSERSDRALADLGLIPDNAKTSTGLGRLFRGDDKDQYSADIKNRSGQVVTKQKGEKFKTENLPKLKDLVTKLNSAVAAVKGSGQSQSQGFSGSGLKMRPGSGTFTIEESFIFKNLLKEFEDEIVDEIKGVYDPQMGGGKNSVKLAPEVQKVYDELKAFIQQFELSMPGDDPEVAKELETAKAALATAEKDGVEKPAAQSPSSGGTSSSYTDPRGNMPTRDSRLARMRELLAKAKQPKVTSPASGTSGQSKGVNTRSDFEENVRLESMSELMARIRRIAEGTDELYEQLSAEEYKELQKLAAELQQEFPDDTEIQTVATQALALPAQFASDTTPADKTGDDKKADDKKADDKKADDKKTAVSDPKVQKVQEQLKALGVDPGPIDGRMGPKTEAGIKAFEKMAGVPETGKITPELEKLLADGPNVVARSKLVQSMTAVEKILTKYKVAESVTLEDLESMTENELRSFVMSNIKVFNESEQMSIMKQYIIESDEDALMEAFKLGGDEWTVVSKNPTTGEIILKNKTGKMQSSTELMKLFPGEMDRLKKLETNVAKSTRVPVTGEVDPRKVQGTGSVKDLSATERDLENIRRRRQGLPPLPSSGTPGAPGGVPGGAPGDAPKVSWFDRAKTAFKGAFRGRAAKGAAVVTAGALALGGLWAAFSGDNAIKMDPADLAELQKHLKVIDEYGKNPEIVKGLPSDVQARLSTIVKNLEKLKKAQATAPAQQASAPASLPPSA